MSLRSMLVLGVVCLLAVAAAALSAAGPVWAQEAAEEKMAEKAAEEMKAAQEPLASRDRAIGFVAVAVLTCVSCLAAAYAVGKVGSAAMGACAEKPELVGRALIFVAIGEGIAVFGVIVALLMLMRL